MDNFKLDPQLANDCFVLGKLDLSLVLLMNNSLLPWFILVPQVNVVEIYELSEQEQSALLSEVNQISKFIKDEFHSEKLNIAAIGNIVKQMHIHIIGRSQSDYCWPKVVWGIDKEDAYSEKEVDKIKSMLESKLNRIL